MIFFDCRFFSVFLRTIVTELVVGCFLSFLIQNLFFCRFLLSFFTILSKTLDRLTHKHNVGVYVWVFVVPLYISHERCTHTHRRHHYAIKINAMRCVATNLLIKNEKIL